MKLTRNLKIYFIVNAASTLFFVLGLTFGLGVTQVSTDPDAYEISMFAPTSPFMWCLVWIISGYLLLKYDDVRGSRKNLQLYYHSIMVTILLFALAALAIIDETSRGIWMVVPVFVLLTSLLVNWFFSRNTLKGIDPKSAFK